VDHFEKCKSLLEARTVKAEAVRVGESTHRRFVFCADPDGLALELHETGDYA
jgi:glyoxylase I family protein